MPHSEKVRAVAPVVSAWRLRATEPRGAMIQEALGFGWVKRDDAVVATTRPKETTMTRLTTAAIEGNYDRFVAELTQLTRKYGVAIKSVGGVILANRPDEFGNMTYVADISSGDLYPRFDD